MGESIDRSELAGAEAEKEASGSIDKEAQQAGDPSAEGTKAVGDLFLKGAIPELIYKAAKSALPGNLDLRLQFLRVLRAFSQTVETSSSLQALIYQDIASDFPQDENAWVFLAKQKLYAFKCSTADTESDAYLEAFQFAIDTFDKAVQVICFLCFSTLSCVHILTYANLMILDGENTPYVGVLRRLL